MQVRKPIKRYSHTPGRENRGFYNGDTFHTPNRDTPAIIPQQEDIHFHQQMKSQNSPDGFTNSACHQFEELKQMGKDDPLMQFLQEQTKQKEDNNPQQHARTQQSQQQRKQLVYNRSNIKARPVSSIGQDSKFIISNNNDDHNNNNNQDSLDSTRSRESLSQWVPPSRYCSETKRKQSCNSVDRSKRIVQKQQPSVDYPNSKELINEWKHFRQFIVVTDARKKLQNLQSNHRHFSRAKPVGAYLTNSYLLEQPQQQQHQLEKQYNNNNNTNFEQKQFFNLSNNSPAKFDKTQGKQISQQNQANHDNGSQQQHSQGQSEQVKIMNFDPFRVDRESPEKEIEGWYMPMGATMPRFLKSRESILHKKDQLKQPTRMKLNDTFVNCNHSSVHTEVSFEARTRATTDDIQMENSSILLKRQNYLHTQDLPVSVIPPSVQQNHSKEGSCFSQRKQDHQQCQKKKEENNNNILKRATTPLQQRTADRLARGYSASQEEIYKPSAIKNHIAQIEEINQKNMMLSNTQQFLMTEYNKFFGQESKQTRGDSPKLFMVNLGAQLSIKSVELSPSLSRQQYRRKKGIGQKDGSPIIVPTRVKILQDILKQQQQQNKQDLPSLLGLKKAI